MPEPDQHYQRNALTASGISPSLCPGSEPAVVVAGDEHDEDGHLIEDAATRIAMMDKRMTKLELLRKDALPPLYEGSRDPDIFLADYGSGPRGPGRVRAERP